MTTKPRATCIHIRVRIIETRRRKADGIVKRHRVCMICGASWWDAPRLRDPVRGKPVAHQRAMVASGAA